MQNDFLLQVLFDVTIHIHPSPISPHHQVFVSIQTRPRYWSSFLADSPEVQEEIERSSNGFYIEKHQCLLMFLNIWKVLKRSLLKESELEKVKPS